MILQVSRSTSPSVERALSILELLVHHPDGMGISELSRALDEAKSSLFVVLSTMQQRGFIEKDLVTKRYTLGPQTLVIGSAYARHTNLLTEFHTVAAELVHACGETVQLAILRGRSILYIGKQEGTYPLRLVAEVGEQVPAHATSLGKVLLSGLSDTIIDELYAGVALERLTTRTIISLDELKQELAQVRMRGYAVDWGETLEEVRCVGVPVYNANGLITAALSISAPITRMDEQRVAALARQAQASARELSRRLGYAMQQGGA